MSLHFNLGVDAVRCANGETWEFFLTLNGKRMIGTGIGIFRTVPPGHTVDQVAAEVARELLTAEHMHSPLEGR